MLFAGGQRVRCPASEVPTVGLPRWSRPQRFLRSDAPTLNLCTNGRSDLPGPLCQIVFGRTGIVYVIAAGWSALACPNASGEQRRFRRGATNNQPPGAGLVASAWALAISSPRAGAIFST
jgi:hypothetical protein